MNHKIAQLFEKAMDRRFPKGQILLYEGDQVNGIHYLISGYVKVYNILETGSERIIFIYGPGDFFPMTSFLSGTGVAYYFYECLTDIDVRILPSEDMAKMIKGNFELGEALMQYTNQMNRQFVQRIDMLNTTNARRKIIALLEFLADKTSSPGEKRQLGLPLTAQNIADMCGLTRETANKKLSALKREGLVSGGKVLTVDMPRLKRRLAG